MVRNAGPDRARGRSPQKRFVLYAIESLPRDIYTDHQPTTTGARYRAAASEGTPGCLTLGCS